MSRANKWGAARGTSVGRALSPRPTEVPALMRLTRDVSRLGAAIYL